MREGEGGGGGGGHDIGGVTFARVDFTSAMFNDDSQTFQNFGTVKINVSYKIYTFEGREEISSGDFITPKILSFDAEKMGLPADEKLGVIKFDIKDTLSSDYIGLWKVEGTTQPVKIENEILVFNENINNYKIIFGYINEITPQVPVSYSTIFLDSGKQSLISETGIGIKNDNVLKINCEIFKDNEKINTITLNTPFKFNVEKGNQIKFKYEEEVNSSVKFLQRSDNIEYSKIDDDLLLVSKDQIFVVAVY